jgi:hypothetical protein
VFPFSKTNSKEATIQRTTMITTNEENKTPEEIQLEIDRLQSEKAASEAKRAETEERQRKDQEQTRQARAAETFRSAVGATGIKFFMEQDDLQTVLKDDALHRHSIEHWRLYPNP